MKKVFQKRLLFSLVLSLLLIYFFSIVFVIAQETIPTPKPEGGMTNFEATGKKAAEFVSNFSGKVFLTQTNISVVLLFILLWMILYSVIKSMDLFKGGSGLWSGSISLIVSLLAFIYLSQNEVLLNIITGEYAGLGATILTVFPFLIAIYFTAWVSPSLIVARAIWGVFAIYYIITFAYVWGVSPSYGFFSPETVAYSLAIIASTILFIFIPFIRQGFWDIQLGAKKEKGKRNVEKAGLGAKLLAKAADELGYSGGGGI